MLHGDSVVPTKIRRRISEKWMAINESLFCPLNEYEWIGHIIISGRAHEQSLKPPARFRHGSWDIPSLGPFGFFDVPSSSPLWHWVYWDDQKNWRTAGLQNQALNSPSTSVSALVSSSSLVVRTTATARRHATYAGRADSSSTGISCGWSSKHAHWIGSDQHKLGVNQSTSNCFFPTAYGRFMLTSDKWWFHGI